MGVGTSHHTSADAPHGPKSGGVRQISHADYKQFGLENFGNTCYANSVLQALYFCQPFRELVCDSHLKSSPPLPPALLPPPPPQPLPSPPPAARKGFRRRDSALFTDDPPVNGHAGARPNTNTAASGPPIPAAPATLFAALRSLFLHIALNPADKGTVSPSSFIKKVKEENELYRSSMHQDAHEFLGFLLNKIVEDLETEIKKNADLSGDDSACMYSYSHYPLIQPPQYRTFVHSLFEGTLTSETRCLTCETVSARDESFLDLSIDIEQNSSVTACLRQFSASEMLSQKNKFFCDSCGGLQEAEKRMKIKQLPNVLALHLKRFKYQEDVQKYIKLSYRVAFPFELRLFNTVDDAPNPDRLYQLFAIVVHIGGGPHHGHYIAIIKAHGTWLVFDDETVEPIRAGDIPKYFGESPGGAGYVLFYQAEDLDLASVGIEAEAAGEEEAPGTEGEAEGGCGCPSRMPNRHRHRHRHRWAPRFSWKSPR
ncbi:hypothetical protein JB92DRAFT_2691746 [Gautieria morchelliformis]|nr:hypothetical protein JB92DRAFT_2691746 [Gautieria morchelliformis]